MKTVTPETFIRAETDQTFSNTLKLSGAVNKFYHFRSVTPLDNQTVIRMNRDVLYSAGVVDTEDGATLTIPEMPDGRYASAMIIDNDHYVPLIIHEPGVHQLPGDTKFIGIALRIQLYNPLDAEEVAMVNRLKDLFIITANSHDEFPEFAWDNDSLRALHNEYNAEFSKYEKYPSDWAGARGKVNEATRHLAAAGAWGLFPEWEATYLNYSGGHDYRICHKATYQVPEYEAFWSITVYGSDGFMKSDNNLVNSSNVKLNADGTFTVFFGSKETCGDVLNRLDTTEGWNFLMRIYRPGKSILDGSYKLPRAVPVE